MAQQSSTMRTQDYLDAAKAYVNGFNELNSTLTRAMNEMGASERVIKMERIRKQYNTYCGILDEINKAVRKNSETWAEQMTKQANLRAGMNMGTDDVDALKKTAQLLSTIVPIATNQDETTYSGLDEKFEKQEKESLARAVVKVCTSGKNYFEADLERKLKKYAELSHLKPFIENLLKQIKAMLEDLADTKLTAFADLTEFQEELVKLNKMVNGVGSDMRDGGKAVADKKVGLRNRK